MIALSQSTSSKKSKSSRKDLTRGHCSTLKRATKLTSGSHSAKSTISKIKLSSQWMSTWASRGQSSAPKHSSISNTQTLICRPNYEWSKMPASWSNSNQSRLVSLSQSFRKPPKRLWLKLMQSQSRRSSKPRRKSPLRASRCSQATRFKF